MYLQPKRLDLIFTIMAESNTEQGTQFPTGQNLLEGSVRLLTASAGLRTSTRAGMSGRRWIFVFTDELRSSGTFHRIQAGDF